MMFVFVTLAIWRGGDDEFVGTKLETQNDPVRVLLVGNVDLGLPNSHVIRVSDLVAYCTVLRTLFRLSSPMKKRKHKYIERLKN